MQEFLHMGGYAYYVWSSFAFGILGISYLYYSAKQSERQNFRIAKMWNLRKAGKQVKLVDEKNIWRFIFPLLAILVPLIKVFQNIS